MKVTEPTLTTTSMVTKEQMSAAASNSNYATYGVLYNWPAVMTEGICPSGWHIPSDGEWQLMEMFLGMSES